MVFGFGAKKQKASAAEPPTFYGWDTPERQTFMVVMLCGLIAAFDFVATLMSIQPFYYLLGGNKTWYGLAVGVYDVGQFVAAPLFGWIADNYGFKCIFAFGVFLTCVGNLLYALLFYIHINHDGGENNRVTNTPAWKVMFVARAIMGIGSAVLIIGSTFIAKKTSMLDRRAALGKYRVFQTVARMVGPMVGFAFIGLPTDLHNDAPLVNQLFNFYTVPGWIAAVLGLAGVFLVLRYFDEKAVADVGGDGRRVGAAMVGALDGRALDGRAVRYDDVALPGGGCSLWGTVSTCLVTRVVWGLALFSIQTNIFAFALAKFHEVHLQFEIWRPYAALGAGSVFAVQVWKRVIAKYPNRVAFEKVWEIGASTLIIVAYCYLPVDGPQPWRMYTSFALLGMGTTLWYANNEIVFSKMLSFRRKEVGNRTGVFMAVYNMSGSLARFAGPFLGSLVMQIENKLTKRTADEEAARMIKTIAADGYYVKSLRDELFVPVLKKLGIAGYPPPAAKAAEFRNALVNKIITADNCPAEFTDAQSEIFSKDPVCTLLPNYFCDDGCDLSNAQEWVIGVIVVSVVAAAVDYFYMYRLCDYEEEEKGEIQKRLIGINSGDDKMGGSQI